MECFKSYKKYIWKFVCWYIQILKVWSIKIFGISLFSRPQNGQLPFLYIIPFTKRNIIPAYSHFSKMFSFNEYKSYLINPLLLRYKLVTNSFLDCYLCYIVAQF